MFNVSYDLSRKYTKIRKIVINNWVQGDVTMIYDKNIAFLQKKIIIFILSMLFLMSFTLQAEEKEELLVLEVYPQWYGGNDYTIQGNIGIEKELKHNNWMDYYASSSVTYALDHNWALHGGMEAHYKYYDDSDNRQELRPYIGISHFYPWTEKWRYSAYFRAEERYFKYSGGENNTNTTRLRLRLRSDYIYNPLSAANTWHKFTVSLEGLRSDNSDQNSVSPDLFDLETRVTLGLEHSLKEQEKIRFELALISKSKPVQSSASSISTIYFKLKYYPMWGSPLQNILFDRSIEE